MRIATAAFLIRTDTTGAAARKEHSMRHKRKGEFMPYRLLGGVSMRRILLSLSMVLTAHGATFATERPFQYQESEISNSGGLDAVTGGQWFNCGPTGIRAEIPMDRLNEYLVKYVFDGSPAANKVFKGDRIIGAKGKVWTEQASKISYHGGANWILQGPRFELGMAIEESEGSKDGKLSLIVIRDGQRKTVDIHLKPIGRFSSTFPKHCEKSEIIIRNAMAFLLEGSRYERGSMLGIARAE